MGTGRYRPVGIGTGQCGGTASVVVPASVVPAQLWWYQPVVLVPASGVGTGQAVVLAWLWWYRHG